MNKLELDSLREFSVIVEGGSGCIFQPHTKEYSYVLTARHVVEGKQNIEILHPKLANKKIETTTLQSIGQPFFHSNNNIDAALIKVRRISFINKLFFEHLNTSIYKNYYLVGYPKSRREKNDKYRANKIQVLNSKVDGYIEAKMESHPSYEEIKGQSGGGIIRFQNDNFFLVGIQKKMVTQDEIELLGRIEFMPLSFFEEIIKAHNLMPLFTQNILIQDKINRLIIIFSRSNVSPTNCDEAINLLSSLANLLPSNSSSNNTYTQKNILERLISMIKIYRPISSKESLKNNKFKTDIIRNLNQLNNLE